MRLVIKRGRHVKLGARARAQRDLFGLGDGDAGGEGAQKTLCCPDTTAATDGLNQGFIDIRQTIAAFCADLYRSACPWAVGAFPIVGIPEWRERDWAVEAGHG